MRFRLCAVSFVVAALYGQALGQTLRPTAIPDTPAGQLLKLWLTAFNSGERQKFETYVKDSDLSQSVEQMAAFRNQTGGFDLLSVESSEPLLIKFRVKEHSSPTVGFGTIQADEAHPTTVKHFGLRALPPGAVLENTKLDAAARQRVIAGAAKNLDEYYVYPETAKKMEAGIQSHQQRGDYDSVTDGEAFAGVLTQHLRDVSHDKHLSVEYNPFRVPPQPAPHAGDDRESGFRKQLARMNCGFEKVEVLPGNVGYLKFNMFASPAICGATASAAMNFLAHVDAVIFDLRENGGGDPKMVAYVSTYLFDKPTHLNDLYNRKENKTTEYWTEASVPGERLAGKPAFVLTSKFTFSGAEEFTYNLKNLKRATIIGEVTGGGAHPVGGHPIDDHFTIAVPFARAVNPVTKTNWEGVGVQPDVPAKASEALDIARKLARAGEGSEKRK